VVWVFAAGAAVFLTGTGSGCLTAFDGDRGVVVRLGEFCELFSPFTFVSFSSFFIVGSEGFASRAFEGREAGVFADMLVGDFFGLGEVIVAELEVVGVFGVFGSTGDFIDGLL
jgi:hypothetical protein